MSTGSEQRIATFYLGDQLMGVDIQGVHEINRQTEATPVPHTPSTVRGVINLRGEVVTVLDLRKVLGLPPSGVREHERAIIVDCEGEKTGLLVDRVADVVTVRGDQIEYPPANVNGVDARFFAGVCKLETDLLVLLDLASVLNTETESSGVGA